MASNALELAKANLESIRNMASVGMAWWTSSVLFCSTTLAVCWLKRDIIRELPNVRVFTRSVTLFFVSVVIFGTFLMVSSEMLRQATLSVLPPEEAKIVSWNFTLVTLGCALGNTSFVLITLCWWQIRRHLHSPSVPDSMPRPPAV